MKKDHIGRVYKNVLNKHQKRNYENWNSVRRCSGKRRAITVKSKKNMEIRKIM